MQLNQLRKHWFGLLIANLLLNVAIYSVMMVSWEEAYARRWLLLAGAGSAYLLWVVWRGLPENHHPGETALLPNLGWGNLLTWLRGLGLAWLAGFLFLPRPEGWLVWLPGILYLLAALADLFDGYLARRADMLSCLGEKLDLLLDGLGVLVAAALIVHYGQVPAWYLLVGLARYLFLAGIWLRAQLGRPVNDLPPSASRRPLAGAQMGFIAVMLFPLFSPPGSYLAAALFGLPFLIGFARDWLAVSGVLKPSGSDSEGQVEKQARHLLRFAATWLPVSLRVLVIGLLAALLVEQFSVFSGLLAQSMATPGGGPVLVWFYTLLALEVLGGMLLGLGAAGRVASLIVLFSLGFYLQVSGLSFVVLAAAVGAAGLFFLGTGPFSLWVPEKSLIGKRQGEA